MMIYEYRIVEADNVKELMEKVQKINPIELVGGAFSFQGKVCQTLLANPSRTSAEEENKRDNEYPDRFQSNLNR